MVCRSAGINAFTCCTPISPGAGPAYSASAKARSCTRTVAAPAGNPVKNTCTTLPDAAGFAAEFAELSWFKIAPGKTPGFDPASSTGRGVDCKPSAETINCALARPANSTGT